MQAPRIQGGGQKYNVANQAGAEGVDRLTLTASQNTSDEVEAPNVDQAKKSLEKQIVALIAYRTKDQYPQGN